MCYSAAEGGQRCHGHATKRLDAAVIRLHKAEAAVEANEPGALEKYYKQRASHRKAIEEYASTLEGAAMLHQALVESETNGVQDDGLRLTIHAGASIARSNRDILNSHRRANGQEPVTTPIPLSLAAEAAQQATADTQAAAKAAREADPLGLRAEAAAESTRVLAAVRELRSLDAARDEARQQAAAASSAAAAAQRAEFDAATHARWAREKEEHRQQLAAMNADGTRANLDAQIAALPEEDRIRLTALSDRVDAANRSNGALPVTPAPKPGGFMSRLLRRR